jgi:hypothetical protein
MPTEATSKSKRRWFQYSLRMLLVVVTLCAVSCSWLAVKLRQARRQREIVAAIEKLGGDVRYDEWFGRDSDQPTRSPAPVWLHNWLGDDFFRTVTVVDFRGNAIGNEDLGHLKSLPHLQSVLVSNTFVTDEGLVHLRGLPTLLNLDLSSLNVTDTGLECLRGLTQLKVLDLLNTKVTDKGVNRLQQALPNCKIMR